jgi:hypothetical protein
MQSFLRKRIKTFDPERKTRKFLILYCLNETPTSLFPSIFSGKQQQMPHIKIIKKGSYLTDLHISSHHEDIPPTSPAGVPVGEDHLSEQEMSR